MVGAGTSISMRYQDFKRKKAEQHDTKSVAITQPVSQHADLDKSAHEGHDPDPIHQRHAG